MHACIYTYIYTYIHTHMHAYIHIYICMYARRPGTIEQLKEAIRQEVVAIPPAMTRKAMDNFRERLQEFVISNGRHLSDVIYKSI